VAQLVEGLNFADLGWGTANASPVTLSFWTYSSIAGTHGGSIQGAGGSRAFPFTYSISSANTWEQKVITVPGDSTGTWYSNNNVGISLYFDLGIGSTYSSSAINNAWVTAASGKNWPTNVVDVVSAANGSFYLTGVQLEKGSVATAFDWRHYTTELQLCQRYFQTYTDAYLVITGTGYNTSAGLQSLFSLNTPMRVAPTVSISGGNNGGAASSLSANYIGTRHITWAVNPTSASTAMYYAWYFTSSAELAVQN
jgi:hypothetical protein